MISKLKFYLLFLTLVSIHINADHPIFILLTHPRATGTAFEKVMRTQEGVQVLHAPYVYPYLVKKYGIDHSFTRNLPDKSLTFDDVTNNLFSLAKKGPVFFKESGYLILDYLKEHPELCKNQQIKIAFLVRDPAKSIVSFYKKMPTVDESIVGHRQLWELFTFIKEQKQDEPIVIDSDEFLKNPLYILNQLGSHWELRFDKNNLQWKAGYAEDWYLQNWYVEVANSTELLSYRGDVPRDENGTPKYLEVVDEKDRSRLQEIFKSQNIYYKQLLNHSLIARN